jgi:hypothetical protein
MMCSVMGSLGEVIASGVGILVGGDVEGADHFVVEIGLDGVDGGLGGVAGFAGGTGEYFLFVELGDELGMVSLRSCSMRSRSSSTLISGMGGGPPLEQGLLDEGGHVGVAGEDGVEVVEAMKPWWQGLIPSGS